MSGNAENGASGDKAAIGLIGLGTMGAALALNIADQGNRIAVTNRTSAKIDEFMDDAGPLRERIVPHADLAEFVGAIAKPRSIIVMIKAGEAVDHQIDALMPLLDVGDAIIDAGNANYRDTERRFKLLDGTGIDFVGLGVSGGEEGARHGPSMMMGGSQKAWESMRAVLESIAARHEGDPCVDRMGPGGSGHFVKTIHNGIEYADMQMIAAVYGIMRDGLGMRAPDMAPVFKRWNEGRLRSYLIEITAEILRVEHDGAPIVDAIEDRAGQKGTGRWASIEALELGVPATAIDEAVAARSLSALKGERVAAEAFYGAENHAIDTADRDAFIADLEQALLGGKIAAYAQGFAVIRAASDREGWNVPLARVAEVWREGCIIRSVFLGEIADALGEDAKLANLLMAPAFRDSVAQCLPAMRRVASQAALHGHPIPALGAALSYLEGYRTARGTANLIQAQRDFFGAHGFSWAGEEGDERHGPWAMPHGEAVHEAMDVADETPAAKT